MIARCGSGDVGDRVASLAHIDGTFESQCRGLTNGECSNVEQAGCRIVRSLCRATIECRGSQACWKQVGEADVSRLTGTVVGNCDVKGNGIPFLGSRISAGECFHSDQISRIVDGNGFNEVITRG